MKLTVLLISLFHSIRISIFGQSLRTVNGLGELESDMALRPEIPPKFYCLTLFNPSGQLINNTPLDTDVIPANLKIQLATSIKAGIYHLKIVSARNRFLKSIGLE